MSVLETIRNSFTFSPPKILQLQSPGKPAIGSVSSPVKRYVVAAIQNAVFAFLILESGQGDEMERFPIRKRITTVGRLQSCDIRIYEETISRLHCQICVDDAGQLVLQIFNPRGVRLNRQRIQKMASTSSAPNIYPLQESDILEMFSHRFRVQMPTPEEHKKKSGRKSFRLSLTKGADGSSKADVEEEDNEELIRDAPEMDKENIQEEIRVSSPVKQQQQQDVFSSDKNEVPFKSRRSFTLKTPAREKGRNGPRDSEPRKKVGRQGSLSPIKKSRPAPAIETRMSILEGGHVHEIPDAGVEGMNLEEELMGRSQEVDTSADVEVVSTPSFQADPAERLTQSASPKKKAKRRSSFFGRAGIFAEINFGFYPEERKDSEEEQAIENDMQIAAFSAPDQIQRPVTPEPPLDSFGRPRLPRSLSSPSGSRSGSPGKRRVISLRTATLIKSGQIAHEQQKLLSPPSSPTRPALSSLSMVVSAGDALKSSDESSCEVNESTRAEDVPLPESDEDDAVDEDEVDKSLSSLMDDMEVEEERLTLFPIPSVKTNVTRRSRQSLAVISPSRKQKTNSRSRVSLPAKIKGNSSNDERVAQWRKERLAQIRPAKVDSIQHEVEDVEMAEADDLQEEEHELGSKAQDEMPSKGEKAIASSEYSMLRHMIRDSASLTSLLDEVTERATRDTEVVHSLDNGSGSHIEVNAASTKQNDNLGEMTNDLTTESPIRVNGKVLRAIPKELLEQSPKPTRRSSEVKPRRRSSVNHTTKMPQRARKSAGAVLITKEESSKEVVDSTMPEVVKPDDEQAVESNVRADAVQEEELDMQPVESSSAVMLDILPPRSPALVVTSSSPRKATKSKKVPTSSPRKRAASPPVQVLDTEIITSRPKRAAKVAAAAAITGEGASLREREASSSPQKRIITQSRLTQSRRLRSVSKEPSSNLSLVSSDDHCELILEPSSPIKRTRRAAKNNAEEKIRAVLTKKPSVALLRDARVLSESGHGLQKANAAGNGNGDKMEVSKVKATARKVVNNTTTNSRIPKKIEIKSEPATRPNRSSRATKK